MRCLVNFWGKMYFILIFCFFLHYTEGVIYRLNDDDYARMPLLVHFDSFEECQKDANALYCRSEFVLVSDTSSALLDMITEYSEQTVTHYNHTKLRYGICVTQTCKQFYNNGAEDPRLALEACLNETFSKKYDLKVKVLAETTCQRPGSRKDIDLLDTIVGGICCFILIANLIGSICHYYCKENSNFIGMRFLLCFSVQRNWKKLMAPPDSRFQDLRGLHGIRLLAMVIVIATHAMMPPMMLPRNPEFIEKKYTSKVVSMFINGSPVVQTFLIVSAFLLVYDALLRFDKHQVSWSMLPKWITLRYLRLTAAYAVVLGLTGTWFRHLTTGPLYHKLVEKEVNDCRQYWWRNILYINNYFNNSECMTEGWYLAVDTQLYYATVILLFICRTSHSRKIMVLMLFLAAIVAPAAHVYFQDLDGLIIGSPEAVQSMFQTDPHYSNVYIPGHNNIIGYAVGISIAFLVYYCQKQGIKFTNYQSFTYRLLYWSLVPLCLLLGYSGHIFYADGSRPSVLVRTLYAAFYKQTYTLCIGAFIFGIIFKFEGFYRGIMEWRGWIIPSRLSYSAYLLHVMILRTYVTSLRDTVLVSDTYIATNTALMLASTFTLALFFWLLVETPFNNVIQECISKPRIEAKEKVMEKNSMKKKEIESKTE